MFTRKKTPIVLNKIQMRLAIELAAQSGAQMELHKQIADQIPGHLSVTVEGFEIDAVVTFPQVDAILGREVVWE